MTGPGKPAVLSKICGLRSERDGAAVEAAGADYAGTILSPGYYRSVTLEQARRVYGACSARRAGVFVSDAADRVADLARALDLDVVQLHGSETPTTVARIAGEGAWQVWKTFHAREGIVLEREIAPYAEVAAGVLVDAWDPEAPGGTGQTFVWSGVAAAVRRASGRAAFIAAGGMNPANVKAAVAALGPDVLDVSSGVEAAKGVKDADKVRAFVRAVQLASAGIGSSGES